MNSIKTYLSAILLVAIHGMLWSQNTQNHIKKTSYTTPVEVSEQTNVNPQQKVELLRYFDGLGRPIQTIAVGQSPSQKNIVTHIAYDKNNRTSKSYLPYASTHNLPDFNLNNLEATLNFYNTETYEHTTNPFSETIYENSPLQRVRYQAAPGIDWKYDKEAVHYVNPVTETIYINPYTVNDIIAITDAQDIDETFLTNSLDLGLNCTTAPVSGFDLLIPVEQFFVCFSQGVLNLTLVSYTHTADNKFKPIYINPDVSYPLGFETPDMDLGYLLDMNENPTNYKMDIINNNLVIHNPNGVECENGIYTTKTVDLTIEKTNVLSYDSATQNGHLIRFDYQTNMADEVLNYRVTHPNDDMEQTELVYNGYYPTHQLYKTITKDENWSPTQAHIKDHTIEEFKDNEGRVILKRTYNENVAHDTQYVYDDFGNLTYVLSPKGSDLVLAEVSYKGNTTAFGFSEIGPQNIKGLTGTGGGTVTVDAVTKKITVDFDFSFNGNYLLQQGAIKLVNSNLPNMPIGTISGAAYEDTSGSALSGYDYNYEVFIEDGYLQISGSGLVNSVNATLEADIPQYYVDATVLDNLCYQYHYDHKNRLIEKKIPAKGWEYIIYDLLDRPVLTQDAVMRADNTWLFTKYDAFSRVAYTGTLLNLDDTRKEFQTRVNAQTELQEAVTSSLNTSIAGYGMYYTNNALQFTDAAISFTDLHTINYYDRYNPQLSAVAANPGTVYGQAISSQTKGLATGSRVKVLDNSGNHWITTVMYYDAKARPIYTASANTYLNTTDAIKTALDFVGKVLQTESTHTKGDTHIDVHDSFTYDHAGRLLTQVQRINNGTPELITNNHYDELGQLISKNVGGTVASLPTQSNGLQTVDYTYNVRGWLKGINEHDNLKDDVFGFQLNYNTTSLAGSEALYNGNISETLWRTSNDVPTQVTAHGYSYQYDALNRIASAVYRNEGSTNFNDAFNLQYTNYDKNGNILSLGRSGWNTNNQSVLTAMDALTYKYNGNQLTGVSDAGDVNHGFKAAFSGYTYDVNGNMLSDTGKGISNIDYNHLNLPTQVEVGNDNIDYIYDAFGVKLRKIVLEGSSETITSYAGNYVYKQDDTGERLEFFSHPEGYIEPDEAGFNYVYQYKDHLGNIRLSYRSNAYEILANDTFEGNTGVWTGSVSIDDERLKVNTTHQYSGTVLLLGSDFSTGEHVDVSFVLDTGNTDILRYFLYETDAGGNVLAYYEVNSNAQNGVHTMSHTIVAGTKLNLKFDKAPNSSDIGNTTHFFIDDIFVNKGSLEIVEENNYYPFGLKHKGYNDVVSANSNSVASKFKYNGKELEESLGLNLYEMDLRQYDPAIARWTSIDPVTHHSMSTYTAFDNNPVFWADPSGADSWTYIGDGQYKNNDTGYTTDNWQRAISETQSLFGEGNNDKETPIQKVARKAITSIANKVNENTDGMMAQSASDSNVNAYQLFYQWVHGTGPDNRNFDENSVMGKQMLKAPEVMDAMSTAAQQAGCEDNCSNVSFFRSLKSENPITYALDDFPRDIDGRNPARGFHGSFSGTITMSGRTKVEGGYIIHMTVNIRDRMTATSGTRASGSKWGYDAKNPVAVYPTENPYGPRGQFRTINVNYSMNVNYFQPTDK